MEKKCLCRPNCQGFINWHTLFISTYIKSISAHPYRLLHGCLIVSCQIYLKVIATISGCSVWSLYGVVSVDFCCLLCQVICLIGASNSLLIYGICRWHCIFFNERATIGFRSRFSQCVDYMRFSEKSFCFRWQETTKLILFFNTKTSSLVVLCDLRYLTGNISSVMTKHMGVQRKLHRFAYLIVQIILWFYS